MKKIYMILLGIILFLIILAYTNPSEKQHRQEVLNSIIFEDDKNKLDDKTVEYIKNISNEKIMKEVTERGNTFFPPNYIPKWACSNRSYPTVQEVFNYVSNKDATADMFEPEDGYSCISLFHGLCE